MPTRNVNLTDELDHFVLQKVQSGRYENASEVVRAALRTLEREEQRHESTLAALRTAIDNWHFRKVVWWRRRCGLPFEARGVPWIGTGNAPGAAAAHDVDEQQQDADREDEAACRRHHPRLSSLPLYEPADPLPAA